MNDWVNTPPSVDFRRLAQLIANIKDDPALVETIQCDTLLLDGGVDLDSLSLTELLLEIEDKLGVRLDFTRLARDHLRTVDTLLTFLRAETA